jgi:hypothetical protein
MRRHVTCMGEVRNAYKIFVRIPERKRSLRKPKHRWEDVIRMDLMEVEWKGVDWMHLAQDRYQWQPLVYMVMNLKVP